MKQKILLSLSFTGILMLANAQSGQLDPTFGNNGFTKTDLGHIFIYDKSGVTVIAKPDGSLYSVIAVNGTVVIGKVHDDGSPDATYGNRGFTTPVNMTFYAAAFQPDGKLVVDGSIRQPTWDPSGSLEIVRFNTDGSLDKTFNQTGKLRLDDSWFSWPGLFKIQDDGKILASYFYEFGSQMVLQRFNNDGSPDLSFNTTGSVIMNADLNTFTSISLQNDGKIILAGSYIYNTYGQLDIARLNQDGTPDNTFNTTGDVITDLGISTTINASAIQSDGKIVVSGYAVDTTGQKDFLVARYNTNGTLDTATFGKNGIKITRFGGRNSVATSVGILQNGEIILGGYSGTVNNDFTTATFSSNGHLDGKVTTDFKSGNDIATGLVIQNNGKVLLLGTTNIGDTDIECAVVHYNREGFPDRTFDHNGRLIIRSTILHPQGDTRFNSTAIQDNGKIIVAGSTWNGNNYDFVVGRYNTNGALDLSFADNGKIITDFNSSSDVANAVTIQKNGEIIVAGSSGNYLALAWYNKNGIFERKQTSTVFPPAISLAVQTDGKLLVNCRSVLLRYNNDGSPDLTFGVDGALQTPFGPYESFNCSAFTVQKDGKIIVIGDGYQSAFVVAKFNTDGTADNTFGLNGSVIYDDNPIGIGYFFGPVSQTNAIAIDSDGKIVIAGTSIYWYRSSNHDIFTARLNADGSFDKIFETYVAGTSNTEIFPQSFGKSMLLQADNKIITGGYSYDGSSYNFTVIRYNTDGSLDHTFNNIGANATLLSSAYNELNAIAISNNKLYAVGFGQYPGDLAIIARYNLTSNSTQPPAPGVTQNGGIGGFRVTAMPNPSQNYFVVTAVSKSDEPVTLTVNDVTGRLVDIKLNIKSNTNIYVGDKLPPGIYFIEVKQGTQRATLKLVKQ